MELDANGDVILMVSPPKQRRAYAPSRVYLDGEAGVVRYRASSKHLTLASQYFQNRLKEEWAEGAELRENGCVDMDVPDTDPNVFLILLNLMHCRMQEVPTSVTFDELVELAVQVDYFKCHGVLGLYPAIWIAPWKAKRPNTYCDEIVKWIFVSGVFNDCELYASATSLAIRQSKDFINTLDLPIPQFVTGAINEDRIIMLRIIIKAAETRRQKLESVEINCTFECDSLRLGTLIKKMKIHGVPWDIANHDLKGLAPESMAKKILEFEKPNPMVACKGRCPGHVGPEAIAERVYRNLRVSRKRKPVGLTLLPEKWR